MSINDNQIIPLFLPNETHSIARLSVMDDQDILRQEEFNVQVNLSQSSSFSI